MTTKKHKTKTHPETGEELPMSEEEQPQQEASTAAADSPTTREPDWSATGCLSVEETEARIRFNERAQQQTK